MDESGPQGLWTNMVLQRPIMETSSVRNPAAGYSDPTQMVTPVPRLQSDSLLDGEKTGAMLLFSGVFLALVGGIFTIMGWQNYLARPTFEWTQLLGPIMISVGGTFLLTSICKFGIITRWPCRQEDEDVVAMEQTSTRHSLTSGGINQPVMLHGATTMFCIPSVYNFINQDVRQPTASQPGGSVSGVHAAAPPYDSLFSVDNAAFTAEEDHTTETGRRRCRTEKTEDERGRDDDDGSTCSHPPAYEDIYPSFSKHNHT